MWRLSNGYARYRKGGAASAFLLACLVRAVWAYPSGVTGFSGLQGATCADRCHGDGAAPTVFFEGPRVVGVGTTSTWRITLELVSPSAMGGGINIAADAGELREGAGLYAADGELTHIAPQRNADANSDKRVSAADVLQMVQLLGTVNPSASCLPADVNGDGREEAADLAALALRLFHSGAAVAWQFEWQAPEVPGPVRFRAAAVGANCNGTNGGDGVGHLAWEVLVEPNQFGRSSDAEFSSDRGNDRNPR